jgi:exopolyphosphatase/guanosine-5'-triphosphate,3'-diphosphate pyrophosphatase
MASYRVGSVAWSIKYFPNGKIDEASFVKAEIAAKAVLDESLNTYKRDAWDIAYGSSGTIGAVFDVLAAAGSTESNISYDGLLWLREKLIKAQHIDRIKLAGLKEDRRAVIAGGVSILCALFDLLKIKTLQPAEGALRQGVLYDLLDRDSGQIDVRNASIKRLARNFGIDASQVNRVSKIASAFFEQIQNNLTIKNSDLAHDSKALEWAAQLHEIGCQISHSDYHKHGAYILDNADIAGFAVSESHRLSMLIFGHRGKLKKIELELADTMFAQQLFCLRLAVIFCHARNDLEIGRIKLSMPKIENRHFFLTLPPDWASEFPQSAHLLREEAVAWKKVNWNLNLLGCEA